MAAEGRRPRQRGHTVGNQRLHPVVRTVMDKRGIGILLLVLVTSLFGAGCSSDGSDRLSSGPSAPEDSDGDTSALISALRSVGSGVGSAPEYAVSPSNAEFCGTADMTQTTGAAAPVDVVATRRCFLDHVTSATAADMVEVNTSVEGDPIVMVWRAVDGGSSVVFTDSTRDAFGSGEWFRQACTSLSTANAVTGSTLTDAAFYCLT
jgi:hypothetical protein